MDKVIEIIGLNKSFGKNEVLKGIDLTVQKGQNIVILGKSGIGKSVLIKCIAGLITPDSGIIKLFGKDQSDFDDERWDEMRMKIGYLFQSGAIYDSMSVRENLEFPVKRIRLTNDMNQIEFMVHEALKNVGLEDAIDKRPSELSGGMRKRLGLARTLILRPQIILYDEPTTGLDPVTSQEISELILEIQSKYNTSSIIITHDMKCAKLTSNYIKMLGHGNFYAEGTYADLYRSSDSEINAYFN